MGSPSPWVRGVPKRTTRAAAALPQTADGALFRITNGKVRIITIIGEVTTAIGAVANATKLKHNPSGVGADVDLCATLDITGDAARTVYSITGVLATAMKSTTLGVVVPADNIAAPGLILDPGDIEIDCAGSDGGGGRVKWTVEWVPLDPDANIAAVA